MRLVLVQGVRHSCVTFISNGTDETKVLGEAIKNAIQGRNILAGEQIGEWEMPTATQILLPLGWKLRRIKEG